MELASLKVKWTGIFLLIEDWKCKANRCCKARLPSTNISFLNIKWKSLFEMPTLVRVTM